jgi:hypothetical protein
MPPKRVTIQPFRRPARASSLVFVSSMQPQTSIEQRVGNGS